MTMVQLFEQFLQIDGLGLFDNTKNHRLFIVRIASRRFHFRPSPVNFILE